MNWQYKLLEFMRGRRGTDQLGFFLLISSFIVEVIGNLFHIKIIYYMGLLMLLIGVYRMFSRNIYKRERENQRFLSIFNGIFGKKNYRKANRSNSKIQYCYYYCPTCKQQVRVPAGNGKVRVTCPKCRSVFELNT